MSIDSEFLERVRRARMPQKRSFFVGSKRNAGTASGILGLVVPIVGDFNSKEVVECVESGAPVIIRINSTLKNRR